MLDVTAIYAALLALLYVALTARVILARRSMSLSLGDGGDKPMMRRIRAHGNAAETIPIALILLAVVELQGAPAPAVHLLGLMLLVGRTLHGVALSRSKPWPLGRIAGMGLTLLMILSAALGLLAHALF